MESQRKQRQRRWLPLRPLHGLLWLRPIVMLSTAHAIWIPSPLPQQHQGIQPQGQSTNGQNGQVKFHGLISTQHRLTQPMHNMLQATQWNMPPRSPTQPPLHDLWKRTGTQSSTAKSWNHRTSHAQHVNANATCQLPAATGHRSPSQANSNPPRVNNLHNNNPHPHTTKAAHHSHGHAPSAKRDITTSPPNATKTFPMDANAQE